MARLAMTLLFLVGLGVASAMAEPSAYSLYAVNCMGCHQRQGQGSGDVPQLSGFVGNFLRVAGGREFLVQVPGVAQSELSDAEVANVLNWMLTEFSADQLMGDFRPYDAREVAAYRPGRLVDVVPARAKLIEAMRAQGILE